MPFGTEKVSGRTTLPPMRAFTVNTYGEVEKHVYAHSLEVSETGALIFFMASIEDNKVVVKIGHMFNDWSECYEDMPTSVTVN